MRGWNGVLDGPPRPGTPVPTAPTTSRRRCGEEWQRLAAARTARTAHPQPARRRAARWPIRSRPTGWRWMTEARRSATGCAWSWRSAGIEPPPEDAQELLEHRIARLSAALSGEAPPDADSVIHDWYCTRPPPIRPSTRALRPRWSRSSRPEAGRPSSPAFP